MTTVELREARAAVVAQARAILKKAEDEKRDLTTEEEAEYDRLMEDVDRRKKVIDRLERQERAEAELEAPGERRGAPLAGTSRGGDGAQAATDEERQRAAYRHWLTHGEVQPELRAAQRKLSTAEYRDTVINNDAKGGYLIAPVRVTDELVQAISAAVWIRRLATVTRVTDARRLGIRRMTSGMNDADWTTEVAPIIEDTGMAFDRRELEPQLYTKLAKVSQRTLLLAADVEQIVREQLSYKAGVTEEKAYLTGNGIAKPLGVFVASANGISTARDVVAGTATAPTADGLIDAKYSLKEGYASDASTRWIFHRDAIRAVRKLKDNNNQYLWSPGLTQGDPDRILDIPFHTSEFAPNVFTTGLYYGVLGAFRFYRIAEVIDLVIQRLVELYAATNEVGFKMMRFVDGAPILEEAFVRLRLA